MSVEKPFSSGIRIPAAVFFLVIVLIFEIGSFRPAEFGARLRVLPSLAGRPSDEAILHGSAFGFDRGYGVFLDGLRRTIPPEASVELRGLGPSSAYEITAAYLLAPRRVITPGGLIRADYAAEFGGGRAPSQLP